MKLIELASYSVYLATYIVIVPILVALYFYKYLSEELKILLWGLVIVFILDIMILFFDAKNSFLYLFSLTDALMFSWLYSKVISNEKISRWVFNTGIFFVPLIALDAIFISGIFENGISNFLVKLYLIILVLYFLTQLFQEESSRNLSEQPIFWISLGVLMYNLVGLFDVFSKPILTYSQNIYLQYYIIWCLFTVGMHGCFTYGIWQQTVFADE